MMSARKWQVRVYVPGAPRLGHCYVTVRADSRDEAIREALSAMRATWACGRPFAAETAVRCDV